MDIEKELSAHLKKFTTAPFLFIGSGFSKRYLNTEDWAGLIRRFCEFVPKNFGYYRSTSNSKWDVAARMLAEDFHQIWWNDEEYYESRLAYEDFATSMYSPLKIEIANYLRKKKYEFGLNTKNDSEIESFKKVVVDGIITTNWDTLIEDILSEQEMTTYIGQKELLFSNNLEINEIYKIHGCSSDPDSLVLTNIDYEDFDGKNAYLAAKLLTIFIEHPVIFIGYSLGDANILKILESIFSCLDSSNIEKLKDRLIFINRARGESDNFQEALMTVNGISIPITKITTDDFTKIYNPLGEIKRKFSTKKLRQMKSEMYELVKHNDPKGKLQVVEYDGNDSENVEFVVGFGIDHFAEKISGYIEKSDSLKPSKLRHSSTGYTSYSRSELLREILLDIDKHSYDYNILVSTTLPEKLKTEHQLPVNRFVKYSNLNEENLDQKIINKRNLKYNDFLSRKQKTEMKKYSFDWELISVNQVYQDYKSLEEKLYHIALLGPKKIDTNELKEVLLNHFDEVDTKGQVGANYRRLFRIYDYLMFGKHTNSKKEVSTV